MFPSPNPNPYQGAPPLPPPPTVAQGGGITQMVYPQHIQQQYVYSYAQLEQPQQLQIFGMPSYQGQQYLYQYLAQQVQVMPPQPQVTPPMLQLHGVITLPSPTQSHVLFTPLTPQHVTFTHGHSQVGLSTPQHSITHESTPTGVGTPSTNVTPKPVDDPEKKPENLENIMVKEEPLTEPLGPSSDDENCVYFKISKSDMNKPDFAKFLLEAIQQKASGDKADTKSDTKIVTEDEKSKMDVTEAQQQTHEQAPVINKIGIDNTTKPNMGPVAFVLPAPPLLPPPPPPNVMHSYYVQPPVLVLQSPEPKFLTSGLTMLVLTTFY